MPTMAPFFIKTAWELSQEYATRDPECIVRQMGITVLHLPMTSIYGLAIALGQYKIIGVKADLPEPARKFVVGHELGHFVLHPKGSFFFILTKTLFYGKHEYQANMFAVALMLGEKLIQHEETIRELAAGKVDKLLAAFCKDDEHNSLLHINRIERR